MKIYYTSIIWLSILLVVPSLLLAQDKGSSKKQQEEMEMRKNKDAILKLVDARSFVIKADMIQDRYLNNYQVNSTINFVKIDSNEAVIQFGFDQVAGWNGVGGLTVDGRIQNYKVKGRSGMDPVSITADISSPGEGFLTLFLTIFNDGMAHATVTGSFGSRITFFGECQSLNGARIYQGTTRY